MNSGWSQMPQQPSYPMAPSRYTPPGPSSRPMSAPHQPQGPGAYQYGQYPPNAYNGKPNRNQHPAPGSYTRPQFNPQTQSFIPHGAMPYIGQAQPQMTGYGGFQTPGHTHMSAQMPRLSPSATSTPSFGSPQSMQGNSSAPTINRIASQSGDAGLSQSSIAKYGTPSHLPAKPPAPLPAQQSAPKFSLPSMTRVPSNMSSGIVNNGPTVSIRGGGQTPLHNTSLN